MQFDYRDVICCTSVLQLVVLIHVIKLNMKIKIVKSVKFHVTSGVVSYKRGLIYKTLKYEHLFDAVDTSFSI
jgi:hypothetical protein